MSEKIVGQSVRRQDGPEKVCGKTRFLDDLSVGGMLHGATVRSPYPHCRIHGIDVSAALEVPGVHCVATAKDVPGRNRIPLVMDDHPVLAEDVARFHGEALALVAAETRAAAKKAAGLVKLDLEELPAITDMDEALERKDVRLHGDDNCFKHFLVERGDLEAGFAEADVIVEGEYETGYQCHAYLECQAMLAIPGASGDITMFGSMQCPFYVHDALAMCLGIPKNHVRVVQTPTGGGFGGKEDVPSVVATHAAVLAHKTGRAVKIVYDREEDFLSMSKRHPGRVWVRYGAKKDGTLTACDVRYRINAGAYSTLSPVVLFRGIAHATGPYRIDNVRVNGWAAATNTVPCGAYRGFGQPQAAFAQEVVIDQLAEELGMDPVDLRLQNALRPGDLTQGGQEVTDSCGLEEAIQAVREAIDWDRIRAEPAAEGPRRRSVGFSASIYGVSLGAAGNHLDRAGSHVQIQGDGSVMVAIGNAEVGQGALTVISQIASEALGCRYEQVRVIDTDTTRLPDSGPTVASRTTVMSGNAVIDGCRTLRANLVEHAGGLLGCEPGQITIVGGRVAGGGEEMSWEDLVASAFRARIKLACQGWYVSPRLHMDEKTQGSIYHCYTYSANAVELEVDVETGEVDLIHCASAHDIGKAINPQQVDGQIEGGNLQGLGYALCEDMPLHEGKLQNTSFAGYILPTAADAPRYTPITIERPWTEGPYGAKGLGEPPLIGMAPAVSNAIHHACGVRLRRTPMRPEHVWEALQEAETGEGGSS